MLNRFLWAAVLACATAPANAQMWDICSDLWLSQGQILDRAGQCFEDPARAALFGNDGCRPEGPALDEAAAQKLSLLASRAASLGCEPIGGETRALLGQRLDLRMGLDEIPIAATKPRGCLQWTGDAVYLYAGPSLDARIIGAAEYGDDIFFEHDTPGTPAGWQYLTIYLDGEQTTLGWTDMEVDEALCGAMTD